MTAKYFLFFVLIFFLHQFLYAVSAQTTKDSWNGWRGFDKEGRSASMSAPTKWSEKENILWKTAIPGYGHSSPVVAGKNIFITTAYKATENKLVLNILTILIIIFSSFVIILFFFHTLRFISYSQNLSIKQFYSICAFSVTLGFVLYFSLTGITFTISDNADHITQSTRWYFSGMIMALCLILLSYSNSYSIKNRIIVILLSVFLSGYIILMRPAPEYYTLTGDGLMANNILNAGIIPILIASIIIVTFFLKNKIINSEEIPPSNKSSKLVKLLFSISTAGLFFVGLYGIGIYRFLRFSLPAKDFSLPELDVYYRDNNVFTGIIFACLLLWSALYIINQFQHNFFKSRLFAIGIICLALCMFIKKNYFTVSDDFIRALICIDTDSGKIKWKKEVFKGPQANIHFDNSPATPTPSVISNRVFAYFGSPGLLCTDTSGNILWENTELPFEDIHGIGASPIFSDSFVIILSDMPKAPYITAINYETGKSVWITKRQPWEGFHGSHRTPAILKSDNKKIILTWGFYGLQGYELFTGKEIFHYPLENSIGQLVASVISNNDTIYAPDRDKFHAFGITSLLQQKYSKIWVTNMKHKGPVCSSPVFFNNMLFMISDNGYVNCLDAISGKILWTEKLSGNYFASCTLIGTNLYFSSTSGVTTVIAAENKFRKISENNLPDPIFASLVPVNNRILIRTTNHIFCIKEK